MVRVLAALPRPFAWYRTYVRKQPEVLRVAHRCLAHWRPVRAAGMVIRQNGPKNRPPPPERGTDPWAPVCRTQLRREGRAPFSAARAGHEDAAGELLTCAL